MSLNLLIKNINKEEDGKTNLTKKSPKASAASKTFVVMLPNHLY
jgi:hypothetical protein